MSKQKQSSFMEELEAWVETNVINPLHEAVTDGDGEACENACQGVKRAIRTKVLESYRNGQQAGPRTAKQPQKGGR